MVETWEIAIGLVIAALTLFMASLLARRRWKFSTLRLLLAVGISSLFLTGCFACWNRAIGMFFPAHASQCAVPAWLHGASLGLVVVISFLLLATEKRKGKLTRSFSRFLKWQHEDEADA